MKKLKIMNTKGLTWYGRCIFLSWYCDMGTCAFCFRSTIKHKVRHAPTAKRSLESILIEALLCKKLEWRIEFLTGGYRIFPINELIEIIKLTNNIYEKKIWLNVGAIKKEDLKKIKPYIKGIVASIETIEPNLHHKICPDKPLSLYEEMFKNAINLKKSITIIIGLGETKKDFQLLKDFINKHKLDRITFYALKPVKGTIYENSPGPKTEEYLWWISQTRKAFPDLEIIAGTTPRRYHEVGQLLKAGATAFTKFPATKMFGTKAAHVIEQQVKEAGFTMESNLTKLPDIDWDAEVDKLDLDEDLKKRMKVKLKLYLDRMRKNVEEFN